MSGVPETPGSESHSISGIRPNSKHGASPVASPWPKIKPTACRRCHSRKVKCSGGHPCRNCNQAGKGSGCVYPPRDRQVKVSQSYLDGLLAEIQQLKSTANPPQSNATIESITPSGDRSPSPRRLDVDNQGSVPDATVNIKAWFVNLNVFHTPILIGEAADAAFATRFRQAISNPLDAQPKHMLLRRSSVLESLEWSIRNPTWSDSLLRCKFWALFAVGELYSARSIASAKDFPGMAYFAKAAKMLGVLDERPSIDSIEIMNILSFYSLALNRRYSAFTLSGTAMRMAIVLGLHLEIPASQLHDAGAREHRRRVFWTTYIFDRIWASKLSHPPAIQDDDIEVDLPSTPIVDQPVVDDFADPAYYIAHTQLAGMVTTVIRTIYRQRNRGTNLSTRAQKSLKDLRAWVDGLPSHLRIDVPRITGTGPNPVTLHLFFNQCVILATRPALLHVLRIHVDWWSSGTPAIEAPASAVALSEACVRCARHSVQLLTECWIDGSFATFDYFYTQYLFSSLTILTVSSVLDGKDSNSDKESFQEAARFLSQLKDAGNFAAQEYCQHVAEIESAVEGVKMRRRDALETASSGEFNFTRLIPEIDDYSPTQATTGTALVEPSLQHLLAQPELDLQFWEGSGSDAYSQGLYWPDFSTEN
ncbi:hypothetical protein AK830_g7347 [Neonectria ditissima]|uniref:Zn(2)-C6 fungal-type domain-containing protein n=1 Tax=Neonectria ditissima TaxID=78410 RepID=A0A0P7BE66_9HYPO|nr:hypothetical protein AK830_g7347 [Neonectria ditissima]